jgi:hypothetical protein
MSFVAVLAACGLPGLLVVARAVPSGGRSRWMALAGSLALLAVGSMQTGWLLRPFLVRPQSDDIVLFRAVEDDVFHGLGLTALSSLHIYREPRPTVEPYERRTR